MGKIVTKQDGQREHAIKRAKERYGVELTGMDLRKMTEMIVNRQSIFVAHKTTRITVHRVKYKGVEFTVAYDKERKTIASILPKEAK